MNTSALKAFVTVMETGSVSLAAERLFVTQPAISKRLRSLEEEFGVRLFDPVGRGIQPTQAAHTLLPKAQRWLLGLDEMRHALSHEHTHVSGPLRMGTSHHIGLHRLAEPLRDFVQRYPDVKLELEFVDSEAAHAAVQSGRVELAFLTLPPTPNSRLVYHAIWNDPLTVTVAPFHPLAKQGEPLQLADLQTHSALLPDLKTFTSQITLAAFKDAGLTPSLNQHNNSLEAIRMLVSMGIGWSVLPVTLLNDEVVALEVADLDLSRALGLVWHPERTLSRPALALRDWFIEPAAPLVGLGC